MYIAKSIAAMLLELSTDFFSDSAQRSVRNTKISGDIL